MTTTSEILTAISQLDDNALSEIINNAISIHKMRRREQHAKKAALLRTAQKVRFIGQNNFRLPYGTEGRVLKINASSVLVDFAVIGRWRIPASFLEPVSQIM